jgi:hypothetical protein
MLRSREAESMERLTAEDRLMLWPDQNWPQHIGALAMLDGASLLDQDGRFLADAVRQAVATRLHLVPRFRQVLRVPPRGLGGPLWVDASSFDIADHVRATPVPAPGDEATLLRVTEQLRRLRLDRSRPLWEMWFLTGLPKRRIGMFVRMHHSPTGSLASRPSVRSLTLPPPKQRPVRRGHGRRCRRRRPGRCSPTTFVSRQPTWATRVLLWPGR